ncbi:MAG: hypothetical protein WKF43_06535 [Acidimicrobiales bacterium]
MLQCSRTAFTRDGWTYPLSLQAKLSPSIACLSSTAAGYGASRKGVLRTAHDALSEACDGDAEIIAAQLIDAASSARDSE